MDDIKDKPAGQSQDDKWHPISKKIINPREVFMEDRERNPDMEQDDSSSNRAETSDE